MAHNISPGKRAALIRGKSLAEVGNMILVVDCGRSCRQRSLLVKDIAGVYGRDHTLGDVLRRMRCHACRSSVVDAWLAPGVGMRGATIPILGRETA